MKTGMEMSQVVAEFKTAAKYKGPCYQTHKPMPLLEDIVIYGGSCINPKILDADIYVGFDKMMTIGAQSYPWNEGESFLYYIQDMGAPRDPVSFKLLIDWLAVQLIARKKVHLGCIGGHGRTGTVLAALVAMMTGELDAIAYVRKHYCDRAVESEEQIKFLGDHYGVLPAKPSKAHFASHVHTPARTNTGWPPMVSVSRLPAHQSKTAAHVKSSPSSIWLDASLTNAQKPDII